MFAALAVTFVLLLGILKLSGSGSSRPMAETWSESAVKSIQGASEWLLSLLRIAKTGDSCVSV